MIVANFPGLFCIVKSMNRKKNNYIQKRIFIFDNLEI